MKRQIDLSDLTAMNAAEFANWLESNTAEGPAISPFDLYNAFVPTLRVAPREAMGHAQVALRFFRDHADTVGELVILELIARIHMLSGSTQEASTCIKQIMDMENDDGQKVAIDLAEDMVMSADDVGLSRDHLPRVVALAQLIYLRYDMQSELAELYLRASALYSRHGATQAAYRCLADAEEIARALESLPLIAGCYAATVVVSCEEHDFKFAIGAARLALKAYKQAELKPPPALFSNLGVALMNCEQLWRATICFGRALHDLEECDGNSAAVRINLAACLRRRHHVREAESELAKVDSARLPPEIKVEHALNSAKLAIAKSQPARLSDQLNVASHALDELLASVLRLHHRRGLRERYILRIEALLRALPERGSAHNVLPSILAARGNAMADWLAVLAWHTDLKHDPRCPPAIAARVERAMRQIRQLGAPHLYGFTEKYDDPWEPGDFGRPWDDLSECCVELKRRGLPVPLQNAGIEGQLALCKERLQSGHCLMAMTYAGTDASLWCILGKNYQRIAIPLTALRTWHRATLEYSERPRERRAFVSALMNLIETLAPLLDPVFETIQRAEAASIRFIEDFACELPLMEFALRNVTLGKRMVAGRFHVRMVPAVVVADFEQTGCSGTTAMIDGTNDLLLPPHEGIAFTRAAGLPPPVNFDAKEGGDLKPSLAGRDVLIVSIHGYSLTYFSDAYFATLGNALEGRGLHVGSLQAEAPDLPVRLVMLNACYSGSRSARNYQKSFRTSDSVAFPNLFLLNRRAIAVANAWRSSDTAGFVLSHLIGEGIGRKLVPSAAISRASALLRELTREETEVILSHIGDETTRVAALDRIRSAPEVGMFSDPYFTAGISIHGLM